MKKLFGFLNFGKTVENVSEVPEKVNDNIKDYRQVKTKRMLIKVLVFVILAVLTAMGVIPNEVLIKYIPFLNMFSLSVISSLTLLL